MTNVIDIPSSGSFYRGPSSRKLMIEALFGGELYANADVRDTKYDTAPVVKYFDGPIYGFDGITYSTVSLFLHPVEVKQSQSLTNASIRPSVEGWIKEAGESIMRQAWARFDDHLITYYSSQTRVDIATPEQRVGNSPLRGTQAIRVHKRGSNNYVIVHDMTDVVIAANMDNMWFDYRMSYDKVTMVSSIPIDIKPIRPRNITLIHI